MKKVRLLTLLIGLITVAASAANAQNKKEQIRILNDRADSLQRVLVKTVDSLHRLEIRLARLEGTTDARQEEMKRLEIRSDSLNRELAGKTSWVEELAAKLAKLNDDWQVKEKEWASRNETLAAELSTYKQKSAPVPDASKVQAEPGSGREPENAAAVKPEAVKSASVAKE